MLHVMLVRTLYLLAHSTR